jgi:hypothetical protein
MSYAGGYGGGYQQRGTGYGGYGGGGGGGTGYGGGYGGGGGGGTGYGGGYGGGGGGFSGGGGKGRRRDNLGGGGGKGRPNNQAPLPFPTEPPYYAYVGNLDFQVDSNTLADYLSQMLPPTQDGQDTTLASTRVVTDKMTGRSRGFGYVEFTAAAGLSAALGLDGADMMGSSLRVNVAAPPRSAPRVAIGGFPQGSGAPLPPPGSNGNGNGAAAPPPAAEASASSSGAVPMPEENFFFELGAGASMVKLLPVIAGVSFSDDEIPGKVRRLLTYGGNVLCKVVEVAGSGDMASAAGGAHGEYFNVNLGGE